MELRKKEYGVELDLIYAIPIFYEYASTLTRSELRVFRSLRFSSIGNDSMVSLVLCSRQHVNYTVYMSILARRRVVVIMRSLMFCSTGLPSDVTVEAGEMSFHLHKKKSLEPETECIHFVDANDITDNENFFEDETETIKLGSLHDLNPDLGELEPLNFNALVNAKFNTIEDIPLDKFYLDDINLIVKDSDLTLSTMEIYSENFDIMVAPTELTPNNSDVVLNNSEVGVSQTNLLPGLNLDLCDPESLDLKVMTKPDLTKNISINLEGINLTSNNSEPILEDEHPIIFWKSIFGVAPQDLYSAVCVLPDVTYLATPCTDFNIRESLSPYLPVVSLTVVPSFVLETLPHLLSPIPAGDSLGYPIMVMSHDPSPYCVPDSYILPSISSSSPIKGHLNPSIFQSVSGLNILLYLFQFPLLSKSILLEKLIAEQCKEEEEGCFIKLPDIPGDSKSFELVAKFCYGVKLELTASNVVCLRCAAEFLQMTEEVAVGNLISQTETFINQVVLLSWKDSLKALQTCEDLLPYAEDLNIVKRCIESLAVKACKDPNLFGWPMMEHGSMLSPGGSVLWNGISTGARTRICSSDWWYEDVSSLSFPTYKRVISAMESRGIKKEIIAGSLTSYAKRYIHGLNKRQNTSNATLDTAPSEEKQRNLLEEIDRLLPFQKGITSTKFLCNLLRFALILKASVSRVRKQYFFCCLEKPNAHPWISESEREQLCRLMDCQKLSLEACTHAAQNERLPLRVVVQVLFFEQLQLRTSIAGCFLVSDNLDGGSRALRQGIEGGGWAISMKDNQILKVGMDHMRMRVSELEKECSTIRQEIDRLGQGRSGWTVVPKKFGFKLKLQMCSAKEDSVNGHQRSTSEKIERLHAKLPRHKRTMSIEK
ncbi:hypothetical protein M5K25_017781 [Dendrobium thyrsiflorum]|uniref:NPH3 domain-containing protein n=1 Tax=Dendrobium thyrsiflorum TaxID=117978 RepID=A0ABD0UGG7_DENTH